MNLRGKTILVLGMGETGLSMVKWLSRQGAQVRVADSRKEPPGWKEISETFPQAQIHRGNFIPEIFGSVDLIAISPGVPVAEPAVQQAIQRGIPLVGDMALFVWALQQSDLPKPKVLAITGSNGKTTVTAMVGAMLKSAGWDVEVAGNIGPAVLNALMHRLDAGSWPNAWVLEVSSFQLETTPHLNADVATVLNVSEDHLDRYTGMQDYTSAKARIFLHEHNNGIQVLNRDDAMVRSMALTGRQKITFGIDEPRTQTDFGIVNDGEDLWLVEGDLQLMKTTELIVNGLHNAANGLAALAMCRALGISAEPLLAALREFRGLPHRMEKVAAFNGVTFYDDSKSTNVGATVAALNGMKQNVILIAGGDGKGQDFSHLRPAVAENTRAVVLIGRDAGIIAEELKDCGVPLHFATTMEEAMQKSFLLAQGGDVVLLSPACASFDMFRNYIHRAEVFVAAVKDIENRFFNFGHKKH
ncbi:UDP-N-acetylmuramoyl-L-alanine--D-glutamate ligase [Nitrosomonas sp. JL21]|uniref:UDP-N-acetylmuramoyl-L-alanine--D-glutamate ligase n=1 Tax=Nitrosomonas sp. JL21 TaxID=153949 RepID=UPI00136933F8|nr:UDP-N-acetylmuramoyl-L-alanine--D-glutamate ligase [Nitrosomonas sp. JL21]MBL8497154.1 UDP-N-acetylmuramoyl-L-alanine--D-glutamate ligase [Nitrosomonas sp.]MCC7092268.1 UDP-N-acetylmuramoyl-L-alanine--D-glutamate ligase [Nitrosomonas sp.]MXS76624.1 UDP-N-acetylmuramoyl-L-alanine--D-glutamate ligase [Nitrosomonas sp. JL21]